MKGTRLKDLCELVGGMGSGTDIKLVASDGYETTLPYSSIYTNPAVQARQGDAILAWYADGAYVPAYADGMRVFFAPDGAMSMASGTCMRPSPIRTGIITMTRGPNTHHVPTLGQMDHDNKDIFLT